MPTVFNAKIIMAETDDERMMREAYEEMVRLENEQFERDQMVLGEVKNRVSEEEFQDIIWSLEFSENTYGYKITDKPKGDFQEESDFNALKGQWVDQTTNGGYVGDDFAGTVSIQIGENEYFEYHYWM